jgi:hypothetical protein
MTPYELEVAANSAAHRILKLEQQSGSTAKDKDDFELVFASTRRSRMLDWIVDAVKESFSVHVLASSQSGPATEVPTVRPGEVLEDNRQWRFWITMPHAFDYGDVQGLGLQTCWRCGQPYEHESHAMDNQKRRFEELALRDAVLNRFDEIWGRFREAGPWLGPEPLLVERSEFDVERAAD